MRPACVLLGANRFLDCEAPLALGDRPVLAFAVEQGALLVTLELTPRLPRCLSMCRAIARPKVRSWCR
jgi:hypothetical protein